MSFNANAAIALLTIGALMIAWVFKLALRNRGLHGFRALGLALVGTIGAGCVIGGMLSLLGWAYL